MKYSNVILLIVGITIVSCSGKKQHQQPSKLPGITGIIGHIDQFKSKYVDARNIDIWLPPGYSENDTTRYDVIYAQDGQNLFDPKKSFTGIDWGLDETMTQLIDSNKIHPAIIVGIWNTPKRVQEYMPRKPLGQPYNNERFLGFVSQYGGQPLSDDYLKFMGDELKPYIDKHYHTLTGPSHTFIMGSSMGGLIALYAISEYPDIFGGAICMSTHWPIANGVTVGYVKDHLPSPQNHKLYFDYGTETLDAQYEQYQTIVDDMVKQAGYEYGINWVTRKFQGADHSERSWRKRVHFPLTFLLDN